MFPAGSRGERIVPQQQDIVSPRLALRGARQWEEPRRGEERVTGNGLTLTERRLLPLFLSGVSVPVLSQLTGRPVKTLYTHRHKILAKTGFRQMAFLRFVYERNGGVPGLEHSDDAMSQKQNQEEEGTGECTV